MNAPTFTLYGGSNYATVRPDDPDAVADGEVFATVADAAIEWARRRNDWSGRFPLWGDCGPDGFAVLVNDETGDVVDGFTPRQLADELGPLAFGELEHYYDLDCWPEPIGDA